MTKKAGKAIRKVEVIVSFDEGVVIIGKETLKVTLNEKKDRKNRKNLETLTPEKYHQYSQYRSK